MRIVKGVTPEFENFEVSIVTQARYRWLQWLFNYREIKIVKGVLEADDATCLVIRNVQTESGDAIFTNGSDDIAITNTAKLLLTQPSIKEGFLRAGFAPKTVSSYEKGLRIVNKNPTVSIAVNVQQELETQNA